MTFSEFKDWLGFIANIMAVVGIPGLLGWSYLKKYVLKSAESENITKRIKETKSRHVPKLKRENINLDTIKGYSLFVIVAISIVQFFACRLTNLTYEYFNLPYKRLDFWGYFVFLKESRLTFLGLFNLCRYSTSRYFNFFCLLFYIYQ